MSSVWNDYYEYKISFREEITTYVTLLPTLINIWI